jgi:transcriptional regulator with XRE-family HTH domain
MVLYSINADVFGRQLHHYRQQAGFTVVQLARAADVFAYAIEKFERGVRSPNPAEAERLAHALGVAVKELCF